MEYNTYSFMKWDCTKNKTNQIQHLYSICNDIVWLTVWWKRYSLTWQLFYLNTSSPSTSTYNKTKLKFMLKDFLNTCINLHVSLFQGRNIITIILKSYTRTLTFNISCNIFFSWCSVGLFGRWTWQESSLFTCRDG